MGMGHVPPRPLREAGEGDDIPRRQHRGAGALGADLTRRSARGAGVPEPDDRTGRVRRLARFGETVAAAFLAGRGARILGRNVRVGRGELDLVVSFGDHTVAVEVKTVGGRAVADGAIARIDGTKLRQVRRLANHLTPQAGPVRVDFVGVHTTAEGVTVDWRKGVA